MSEKNTAIVRRFFEEFCNGRKLAIADQLFTAKHVYHDPASPWVGPGPEGMKQLISTYQSAFPDAHWTVEATLVAGDTVVTRWKGHGTHKADLRGIVPTGKEVTVHGIWIHRIAAGRIAESWNVWDTLGMMQQLGLVPMLGQASKQAKR